MGYRGVMQDNPLSPTISNVVVGAIIFHWVTVVMPTEAGTGGLGMTIIDLVAYFYANNGLVASTQMERLNRAFDVLAGLFGQVDIQMNTEKTVGMVCQPCHAPVRMSEEANARWTTGIGPTFWERQRRRVE